MRRQGSSEPKGSNRKAASSQHSTPMDYEYSRSYALDPSGPMAMNYSWPAEEPPITLLPSVAHLEPGVRPWRNLRHLLDNPERNANVDPEDIILEDWERFHATRDKTESSGYEHFGLQSNASKINSLRKFPLGYDGTTLELGRPDEINTSHGTRKDSLFSLSSMRKSEPSLYNQKSSDSAAAKSSGTSNTAARSKTAKRLVVKLRYGGHNRLRVANMLKLPVERDIDGFLPPPKTAEPINFSHNLPSPIPFRSLNKLRDERRYTHVLGQARYMESEALDKDNNRLPPSKLDRRSSEISAILGIGNVDTGAIFDSRPRFPSTAISTSNSNPPRRRTSHQTKLTGLQSRYTTVDI